MEVASSGMATYGNKFSEIIGLVTAGTEIMQGRSLQVARGLSTIASRIVKNQDALAEYGITVENVDGSLKSTFDVLSELKSKWDSMTDAQRTALGDTLAGTNQYKVLAAVLQNFEHATTASETALNSAGSAAQENAKYLESLEAREQSLKAEFEDFANRVLSKDVVAGFYDAGEAALKFINTDFGAAVTRITGTTAAITSLVGILGTMGAKLTLVGKQLQSFGAADGILGLLTTPKTLAIIGGVVAVTALVVEAAKGIKQLIDKANPSFEEANKNLQETQTEIENTTTELEEYKKKIQELDQIDPKDRASGWSTERAELETNVQTAQAYLEVLKQIEQAQTGKIEGSNYTTGYRGLTSGNFGDGYIGTAASGQLAVTDKQLKAINAEYSTQEEAIMSISLALKDYITGWETFNDMSMDEVTEELEKQLAGLGVRIGTVTETMEDSFSNMGALANKASDGFDKLTKSEQEQANRYLTDYQSLVSSWMDNQNVLTDAQKEQLKIYIDLQVAANGYADSSKNVVDRIADVANSMGITAEEAAQALITTGELDSANRMATQGLVLLSNGMYAARDKCVQLEDGTWQLKEAVDDLGGAAEDTGETIGKVLTDSLFDVNGNLTETAKTALTTNSALKDLAIAELEAQQEAAQSNYRKLISEIQQVGSAAMISAGQLQTMMALAGASSASDLVGGLASGGADTESSLKAAFYRTFGKSAESDIVLYNKWVSSRISSVGESNYNKIISDTQKRLDEISKNFSTGTGGGGSSVKKSIDETADYAEKKAKEAAEKAAQEAEQAAQEAAEKVKEQINEAFDALKETEEAYWDDKIDALETQNKLLDRQTQLEEKLKALQEAKQRRILLYKDGRFQYSEDVDKISSAQYEYDETYRNIYIEEQKEILNDLKDKALALIEEYRDAALENGELNKENISALLDDYRALGDTTYQTIAYGVDNITNLIASGMSAISGTSTTIGTSVTGTMNTIGSAMTKMTGSVSSAAGLLNKQFGDKLSAIQGAVSGTGVGSIGGSQSLSAFRDKHWGETTGKFNKLSLLYGGGQAWWMGMMSKYLEDPEKNANLQIGTKDDGSPLTLKELYETDWAKEASKMDSVGGIEDYIQRAQAKSILSGGTKADYDALNKIAQDAYREAYFRNPRTIAPSAKWYGGYDPKFSAAQYAVDAALRYSGSTHDVFDVEGAHTSGMSAGRVSDLKFLEELVEQGKKSGASGVSQTQAVWAKSELEKRYQTSYKSTVDAIDKQIAENSQKWYTASDEEKERLHLLNEELRKNRSEYANKINKNASGTTSSRGGLSLVGEEGPELRVLNRGDGVLPTDITNNLWRWGSMTPSDMLSSLAQKAQSLAQTLNINNVTLPNVRDAQSFVSGLRELAQQYVTRRN